MNGYITDIEDKTLKNNYFREVLYTTSRSQLVVMALKAGEEIGEEVHADHDQFIRIESGTGKAVLDNEEQTIADGSAVVVPAGVKHNIINTGKDEMKLYTLYTPPEHKSGTIHKTKAEAEVAH